MTIDELRQRLEKLVEDWHNRDTRTWELAADELSALLKEIARPKDKPVEPWTSEPEL